MSNAVVQCWSHYPHPPHKYRRGVGAKWMCPGLESAAGLWDHAFEKDLDWVEHEGYPRDMTVDEETAFERTMRGLSIDINSTSAVMRTSSTQISTHGGVMAVGDLVGLDEKGRVVKVDTGKTSIGRVQEFDLMRNQVVIQMHRAEYDREDISSDPATYDDGFMSSGMDRVLKDLQSKDPLLQRLKKALGMR